MVSSELYDLTMDAYFALKIWKQIVQKSVGELVYYTVGYMQMTEEQVFVLEILQLVISAICS